jgi:hypothetical protein
MRGRGCLGWTLGSRRPYSIFRKVEIGIKRNSVPEAAGYIFSRGLSRVADMYPSLPIPSRKYLGGFSGESYKLRWARVMSRCVKKRQFVLDLLGS